MSYADSLKKPEEAFDLEDIFKYEDLIPASDGDTTLIAYTARIKAKDDKPAKFLDDDGDEQQFLTHYQSYWATKEGAQKNLEENISPDELPNYEVCAVAVLVRVMGIE